MEEGTTVMESGKTSFARKLKNPWSAPSVNRTASVGGELCPKTFIQRFIYKQEATMNVPFGSAFIMNVQQTHIQTLGISPLILFVKGSSNMCARSESPRRKKKKTQSSTVNPLANRGFFIPFIMMSQEEGNWPF